MYIPVNYDCINAMAGTYSPSSVKSYNNYSFSYWERALFQRACSVFVFDVPDNWDGKIKDFFLYCLFRFGFVAISKNDRYGYFFQPCTLGGKFSFYYQPTSVLIANPDLNVELQIGSECEILKLTPDYMGVWDIISHFAAKLSELDNAIDMSIINSKVPYVLGAKTKSGITALKKIWDKISAGQPAVFFDSRIMDSEDNRNSESPFQFLERKNIKDAYLTTDQLRDRNTLLNAFDAEIGIPSIPVEKKERMIESEAESRVVDAVSRITVWKDTLDGSLKEIKKLYPDLDLTISMRYPDIMKGGDSNVME